MKVLDIVLNKVLKDKGWVIISFIICNLSFSPAGAQKLSSPNGKLTVDVGSSELNVAYQKQQVMKIETGQLTPNTQHPTPIKADYKMVSGKRLHCINAANEYRWVVSAGGELVVRVYNDGLAFRYIGLTGEEPTTYVIPEGTRRWMQQWSDGYEGFFPLSTTYKVTPVRSYSGTFKSADGWCNRWGYPALIELTSSPNTQHLTRNTPVFALITEANIEMGQSASSLYNDGERYRVVQSEHVAGKNTDYEQGKGRTPWRVVIIGRLADVVESTLVTDVSDPCRISDVSWIQPGVVSWVYWAYNHGSNDYNIIKKYVDLAATLHLPYVLIDAEWDTMKDGKTIEDAVNYAKSQGVKPMIWYNSSVGWVDGAPTPKYRLNKAFDREQEFAWCEKIGVVGVKIDFFSGDNQMNMDYCQDLLESAARHHLYVNFHGATIPRGWQRTWPNLLSTEGVYGAEWYNNVPTFTDKAACHNATLPFTRNVIGPMDYTPCAFSNSQHPHITSNAHELALTVLFESGLQHLADRPESFLAQPQQVQQFLSELPAAWDETRFVSGYPGESCVIARRKGNTWYVAGINGTDEAKTLNIDLSFIRGKGKVTVFADTATEPWAISTTSTLPKKVECQPRGGFLIKVKR